MPPNGFACRISELISSRRRLHGPGCSPHEDPTRSTRSTEWFAATRMRRSTSTNAVIPATGARQPCYLTTGATAPGRTTPILRCASHHLLRGRRRPNAAGFRMPHRADPRRHHRPRHHRDSAVRASARMRGTGSAPIAARRAPPTASVRGRTCADAPMRLCAGTLSLRYRGG